NVTYDCEYKKRAKEKLAERVAEDHLRSKHKEDDLYKRVNCGADCEEEKKTLAQNLSARWIAKNKVGEKLLLLVCCL
ncbi:unnamed protein product, partial [Cylicostephanus goldi]